MDFVHTSSPAKIALQLGHSGAKGSTRLGWDAIDVPLEEGNWPLIAASPVPWSTANQTPREMTRADMDQVRDLALEHRPKLIVAGTTSYPRRLDPAAFKAIDGAKKLRFETKTKRARELFPWLVTGSLGLLLVGGLRALARGEHFRKAGAEAARHRAVDALMGQQHAALDPKPYRECAQRLAQLPEVRQGGELVEGSDLERHGDHLSGRPGRGNPV